MGFVVTPYVVLYAATGLVSALVAVVAWRRRMRAGARSITLMLFSVAWWGLVGAVELGVVGVEAKFFWSKICYVGTLAAPVALLVFAFDARQMLDWLRPARVAGVCLVPLLALGLAATNEWHHLVWSSVSPGPAGSNLMVYGHGPAFWVAVVGYSYVCIGISSLLLIELTVRLSRVHRWRMTLVLVAIALPWVGNFVYIAGLSPVPLDLAPIALALTGAIFLWVLVGSRLSELVPLARLQLIERLPDAVIVLDANDRVAEVNPTASRWLSLQEMRPDGAELRAILSPLWQPLLTLPANGRIEFANKPPDPRSFEAESIELLSPAGRREGRLLIISETTARTKALAAQWEMERRASRAEKNASLGLFAAGVAHDFNNLMSVVLGRLSLAEMRLPTGSDAELDIQEAERASRRVAELTRQILLYAGVHDLQTTIELAPAVRVLAAEARPLLTPGTTLTVDVPKDLPPIVGNLGQIETACRNILANAVESLSGGPGAIAIRAFTEMTTSLGSSPFTWEQNAPSGPSVVLEIADTGCGMDDIVRSRMFEPFFSTKFMGRGLGLAAVWGIVHSHGGAIGVATSPGGGTRIQLVFPVAPDEARLTP